jgi:hypothetical protein
MGKVIIEYMPELSNEAVKIIKENVTYSMISIDETTCQYDVDRCIETLEIYDDVYSGDLWKINELILDGVSYLEL